MFFRSPAMVVNRYLSSYLNPFLVNFVMEMLDFNLKIKWKAIKVGENNEEFLLFFLLTSTAAM